MRRRVTYVLSAIAVAASLVVAMAGSAQATFVYWNSRTSPLTVTDDGRQLGQAYGSVQMQPGNDPLHVKYNGRGYLRDRRPGGNPVYWQNTVWGSASTSGYFIVKSDRWSGSSWKLETKYRNQGTSAKWESFEAQVFVCEDRRLSPDKCKGRWLPDRYPIRN